MLNKVFQLVPFITLSNFSIGNVEKYALVIVFSKITLCIESAMANSELITAIQATKNGTHDRKNKCMLGFGRCCLRALKHQTINYVATSFALICFDL